MLLAPPELRYSDTAAAFSRHSKPALPYAAHVYGDAQCRQERSSRLDGHYFLDGAVAEDFGKLQDTTSPPPV